MVLRRLGLLSSVDDVVPSPLRRARRGKVNDRRFDPWFRGKSDESTGVAEEDKERDFNPLRPLGMDGGF